VNSNCTFLSFAFENQTNNIFGLQALGMFSIQDSGQCQTDRLVVSGSGMCMLQVSGELQNKLGCKDNWYGVVFLLFVSRLFAVKLFPSCCFPRK
jgi:hypothetical protein